VTSTESKYYLSTFTRHEVIWKLFCNDWQLMTQLLRARMKTTQQNFTNWPKLKIFKSLFILFYRDSSSTSEYLMFQPVLSYTQKHKLYGYECMYCTHVGVCVFGGVFVHNKQVCRLQYSVCIVYILCLSIYIETYDKTHWIISCSWWLCTNKLSMTWMFAARFMYSILCIEYEHRVLRDWVSTLMK